MIILWGLPGDSPLARVRDVLDKTKASAVLLDQRQVLQISVDPVGRICTPAGAINLPDVKAAYLRPYDSLRLPAVVSAGVGSSAWKHALTIDDALWTWADLASALVINRPSAMASNNSKPYQAMLIAAAGFLVPKTLITTDPDAARDFWEQHGDVVYKSISGIRSIVSRLTVKDMARLNRVAWCPTQFQQYISGTDYRVHVVGERIFACEIRSEADDYRYASHQGVSLKILPCSLCEWCQERCRKLVARLGLEVAGIDLRRTAVGNWYCFEVNPSPGFTFYEAGPDYPIAGAIAELLMGRPG